MSITRSFMMLLGCSIGLVTTSLAQQVNNIELPTGPDDKAVLAKFKSSWRALSGESVDDIIRRASEVAQFVPRSWTVDMVKNKGGSITLAWALRFSDKPGDEYTISWAILPDGTFQLPADYYAKSFELGWQAFAVSLIENEITSGEKGANVKFIKTLANYNFVSTAQGNLGDLLSRGRCSIGDPVGMDHVKGKHRLQLSVKCNIPGPAYFTEDGVVIFEKAGNAPWKSASFFARRIASYPPGQWFSQPDAQEDAMFEATRSAARRLQQR